VAPIFCGPLLERVPIDINKGIFDYDLIVILGPVFPHEVVGFSGGHSIFSPVSQAANSSISSTGWAR